MTEYLQINLIMNANNLHCYAHYRNYSSRSILIVLIDNERNMQIK